jgi:CheY-like chemotaxis protein
MAKILIVDDDPDMVLATRLCLEGAGYQVIEAGSGAEALDRIRLDRPDLIILDVMMSTATEGFHLALSLRSPDPSSDLAAFRDTPIILLTAIHSTSPVRLGPDEDYLPVDAFIDKPINPDALVRQVQTLLEGGPASR